jgi:putative endonuclease
MFNFFKQKPKTLGQIGEELAQLEYKKRGYEIVAANFFNKKGLRKGEIDVIVKNKQLLIFVEVKTRSHDSSRFGTPEESVNIFKQIKLLKAVKIFLLNHRELVNLKPQIDVCVIIIGNFDQLKLVETDPAKYIAPNGIDKINYSATIIPNAVEDWN